MIGRLLALFARRPDPSAAIRRFDAPAVCEMVRLSGNVSGRPRGLRWQAVTPDAPPTLAWDGRKLLGFLPVTVQFEPIPGSDMEEVEAAGLPRPAVVVCRWTGQDWRPDPKPVLNLRIPQLIERANGRLRPVAGA